MELSAEQTAAALANAVSFAGGVLQSFADGTDEWRYQVGVVARNGLVAAELARAGSVSAPNAFEGKSGFARAFGRIDLDLTNLVASSRHGLGHSARGVQAVPGVRLQPNAGHRHAGSARTIARSAGKSARTHESSYETGYAGMDAVGPFSTISGTLMSIPFCIATTLVHGAPTTRHMTTYDDPAVNDLITRVELVSQASIPILSAVIEAETADGAKQVREQRMTAATMPTICRHFRRCCAGSAARRTCRCRPSIGSSALSSDCRKARSTM